MPATMLQLDPAIAVLGFQGGKWRKAWCHGWIDYGIEADLLWICFMDETGECWTLSNKNIRAQMNISMGRTSGPGSGMKAP